MPNFTLIGIYYRPYGTKIANLTNFAFTEGSRTYGLIKWGPNLARDSIPIVYANMPYFVWIVLFCRPWGA